MKRFHIINGLTKTARLDIAMLAGLVAAFLMTGFTTFSRECEKLQTEVFRMHILANSDSDEDQKLKYELRDFILTEYGDELGESESLTQAEGKAAACLTRIESSAQEFVCAKGYTYKVECEIVNMFFDTRVYENMTMPAGNYDALRITIGAAEGKNWWCMMYPPLCLPAATVRQYFTEEESKLIEESEDVEYRFAIYEFFKMLFSGWGR